jgi:TIR domain-containing protein
MSLSRLSILAANPRDRYTPLRQMDEVNRLRGKLAASTLRRRIHIDEHLSAQLPVLERVLRDVPEVFYFTGFHVSEQGGIVLEDASGNSLSLETAALTQRFSDAPRGIRLAFLCTCYSADSAKALSAFVDAAVGFRGLVADDYANVFAEHFFGALFNRRPVSEAFDRAVEAAQADVKVAKAQKTIGVLDTQRLYFKKGVEAREHLAFSARPVSVFISFGGPDEKAATRLEIALKARGVKTFLFTHDAKAGQPLHRMMRDGVNEHDWVLLLCSRNSLNRPGVLNEIEESMRRSSRGGGRNILVPIALDDYVFAEWKPERSDLALYIRDLVIARFSGAFETDRALDEAADKLVEQLSAPE